MKVPRFVVLSSLVLVGAAASIPLVLEAKNAALARAAPALAKLIQPTTLAEGDDIKGIVVLGGGGMNRLREALNLAIHYPKATMLLSGPGNMEKAFLAGSNDPALSRLILDLRAKNTFENARLSKELAQPRAGQRWVLVTSAIHMPRALTAFCSVGFQVEPWPVDDTPSEYREAARRVQHEVLGLVGYRVAGRTRAFLKSASQDCASSI